MCILWLTITPQLCAYIADANKVQAVEVVNPSNIVVETLSGTPFHLCNQFPDFVTDEHCAVDRATSIMVDLIVAWALLYFVITYSLLAFKLRGYRKQPYTFVQVGLVYNTLQV